MSIPSQRARQAIRSLEKSSHIADLAKQLADRKNSPLPNTPQVPTNEPYSVEGQNERLTFIQEQRGLQMDALRGDKAFDKHGSLQGNIENFLGMAQIPVGLAGPLLINGMSANGDFFVPLATTEGALVASYNRGMKASRQSGGISSVCLVEGVQRSPYFKFENVIEAGRFIGWMVEHLDAFAAITEQSSRFAKLEDVKTNIEGNNVILTFEFTTGDAAGQNMVTICTQAICEYILKNTPVRPKTWFIESNYSGDKKATALSFTNVRGKKVVSEVVLKAEVVRDILKADPKGMVEYWKASTLAVIQSGAIGAHGHIANGLTALFIACGQDVACIAEASVGVTHMELTPEGNLYASVTLPSLIVGTVGGGTSLPTQRECLELLDCYGAGKARKFAEICGAVALTGELSIAAAISAGHFSQAHQRLGRKAKG